VSSDRSGPSPGHFAVVVAADRDRGIGKDGVMPWRLPGDMAFFKTLTRDSRDPGDTVNTVVMGRKTWDSIPPRFRPLRGRRNIVISRQTSLELPAEVVRASSLDHALQCTPSPGGRVFIIGGGQIYADALARPSCRAIYLTRIDASFDCDVFLPPFEADFERTEILRQDRDNDLDYRIELWHRKPGS